MSATTEVSCSVSVPYSSSVSAIHLLGERVTRHFCCFRRRRFTRFLTIQLQPSADTLEFRECRVTVERKVVARLEADCAARLKVKDGRRTIRKQSVDARQILDLLQADRQQRDKIHLSVVISSFAPLAVSLQATVTSPEKLSLEQEIDLLASEAEAARVQPFKTEPLLALEAEAAGAQPRDDEEQLACEDPLAGEFEAVEAQPSPPAPVRTATVPQAPRRWRMGVPRRYRRRLVQGGEECVVAALRRTHNVTVDYDVRSGDITLFGFINDIMGCHDDVEGTLRAWLHQDKEAGTNGQGSKNSGKKRVRRRQTKENLGRNLSFEYENRAATAHSPPSCANTSPAVKANSAINTSTSKDELNSAVKSCAACAKRLSYAHVVTGNTPMAETVTEKLNVNSSVKKKVKTWAEEVDEAHENSPNLHAFPVTYKVDSCPPANTTSACPESSLSLQHSAASPAAAALSSSHSRPGTTTAAPDEPVVVVVYRHGRPYVCPREDAHARGQFRAAHPRPPGQANRRPPSAPDANSSGRRRRRHKIK